MHSLCPALQASHDRALVLTFPGKRQQVGGIAVCPPVSPPGFSRPRCATAGNPERTNRPFVHKRMRILIGRVVNERAIANARFQGLRFWKHAWPVHVNAQRRSTLRTLVCDRWNPGYPPANQVERYEYRESVQFARVRAAAYSSRIAVTGFQRIARCAGR